MNAGEHFFLLADHLPPKFYRYYQQYEIVHRYSKLHMRQGPHAHVPWHSVTVHASYCLPALKYTGGVSSVNPSLAGGEVSWILCLPVSDVPYIHLSALVDVVSLFLLLGA